MRFGGTYACPICFKDTPHEHTGLEVYRHHEEQLEYHKLESPAHEALRAEQKIRRGTLAARGHKAREDTALALKGKPAPLTLHSWHDLAAIATELKAQYDKTQQWIPTSQAMPQQGALIVKRWKEGTVWAGVYHGGAKDSSFDEWYPLPK